MAMTRAEKDIMQRLDQQLGMALAFHFTQDVQPDVPPPASYTQGLSTGFRIFETSDSKLVEAWCSSSTANGSGWQRTTSQNPMWLYSTELRAFKALRRCKEIQFANFLSELDKKIAFLDKNVRKLP